MSLLPKHNMSQYYRYYGSLTTPPCSQVVVWTLYEVPIYIAWSQVGLLTPSEGDFQWQMASWVLWINSIIWYPPTSPLSWLSLRRRSSPPRRMRSRWRPCRTTSGTFTPPSVASSPRPKRPDSSRGRPVVPSGQLCQCSCFRCFYWEASSLHSSPLLFTTQNTKQVSFAVKEGVFLGVTNSL